MAHRSLAESHGAMGCEGNAGDYAKGRRIMMPADACSRRIFGHQDFGERLRLNMRGIRGAGADQVELVRNFGGRAEVMGSECVAQTEMSDAAFGDNAMHADFAEVELADGLD